jgi:hypothetical protein
MWHVLSLGAGGGLSDVLEVLEKVTEAEAVFRSIAFLRFD